MSEISDKNTLLFTKRIPYVINEWQKHTSVNQVSILCQKQVIKTHFCLPSVDPMW